MQTTDHHSNRLRIPILDKTKFMTLQEAAEYLNYSVRTLYKMSSQNPELSKKKIKTYNGRVYFKIADLERYLFKLYSPVKKNPEKD